MKFKKIYIEITNACNFNCSFCYQTKRPKHSLTIDEFRLIGEKIKPFTDYIYLHVLGEPLLHPHFEEILKIASDLGFWVNITTNGSLIEKQQEALLKYPPRQINISLHDLEENISKDNIPDVLTSIVSFSKKIAPFTHVNFRLWNRTDGSENIFNNQILSLLKHQLACNTDSFSDENLFKGISLSENIYLHTAVRFHWPHADNASNEQSKTCYALRDHIAILSDGDVVPCCIDADANLKLGNIFTNDLHDMLQKPWVIKMKQGFERKEAVEEFCKKCGFR